MRVIVLSMDLTELLIIAVTTPAAIIPAPVNFKSNKKEQPIGFPDIFCSPVGRSFCIHILEINTVSEYGLKAGSESISTLSKRYEI